MSIDKPQYNKARDFLKILAIITMTADHASTVFLKEVIFTTYVSSSGISQS
jgi:hypothetical protein